MSPSNNHNNSNNPHLPSNIHKAIIQSSSYASDIQDLVSSYTDAASLLSDSAYRYATNDITRSITNLSSIISDSAVSQFQSMSKSLSSINTDALSRLLSSSLVTDKSSFSNLSLLNTAIDSIKSISIDFTSLTDSLASIKLSYDQYRPVSDLLDIMVNNDLIPTIDPSETVTEPLNIIQSPSPNNTFLTLRLSDVINIFLAIIVPILLSLYGPNQVADNTEELINIEHQQLQLQQDQHNESVRHNKVSEETNEDINIQLGQIVQLLSEFIEEFETEDKQDK